jgi:hypothetical protein
MVCSEICPKKENKLCIHKPAKGVVWKAMICSCCQIQGPHRKTHVSRYLVVLRLETFAKRVHLSARIEGIGIDGGQPDAR